MSVAIIQGSSGALGLALTRHMLQNTRLKVYALTHASSSTTLTEQLGSTSQDRLTVLSNVDVREEESLVDAAKTVGEREGKGSVRLVACLAGILHPEKSLSGINIDHALDTFRINTLGHLMTYKHFVPLIPNKRESKAWAEDDLADGLVGRENSLCFSLSARVGSIGDNERGGWYSYRASKAALNQVIRTLDHELINKSSSALAIAYHPGTVLTPFTRPVIGDAEPNPDKGVFTIDQAIGHMIRVMSRATRSGEQTWGGRCWDWKGERIPW